MHRFEYEEIIEKIKMPEIVRRVKEIEEYKGRQEQFRDDHEDELKDCLRPVMIQNAISSNRIEGVFANRRRVVEILEERSGFRNSAERLVAGLFKVGELVDESFEYIPVQPGVILQLHRDLYAFSDGEVGGVYKNSDNVIAETDKNGARKVRFQPVPAFQTSRMIEEMCGRFNQAWNDSSIDKLLLIPVWVLDFLCIHPFADGNGRMSRILTSLLLYKAGYDIGRYVSLDQLIEESQEEYYEALQKSSEGWHESENDYGPFVEYFLKVLDRGYGEFEERVLREK